MAPVLSKPLTKDAAQALHPCRCSKHLSHRQVQVTLDDGTKVVVMVCPMEDTQQNAAAVESNIAGGVMVTEHQLPPQQASEFKAADLAFLSIADHTRSQLFDYENATVQALYMAATSGSADFNSVVSEFGRRQAMSTDTSEQTRLSGMISSMVNLTKMGICLVNPIKGNCTYLWAMASNFVNKLGAPITSTLDVTRTLTDLMNDTVVTSQRKIIRMDTIPKFYMVCHYYAVFSTVSGNNPFEVCNHFFSGAVFELMAVHGKSMWTAQEYVIYLLDHHDKNVRSTTFVSILELDRSTILASCEVLGITTMNSFGVAPKSGQSTEAMIEEEDARVKSAGIKAAKAAEDSRLAWNIDGTPTSSQICAAWNNKSKHKASDLNADGRCVRMHACNQFVTNKDRPDGKCGGNHRRGQCRNEDKGPNPNTDK